MALQTLRDPPDLQQYAARGDPPVEEWPGRLVTTQDLQMAHGDPRDWFRYGHRLQAYEESWREFVDARRKRRNFMAGFSWNQILVIGDYGAKKTTLAVHLARHYFGLGHAVFSNASCLFGFRLEREQMYTALGSMPKNSVLLIDESSAALASGVGHGVAVSSFGEMNLNIRKQNCIVVYMSAQDWMIAPVIRRDCKEVWMPVKDDDLDIDDDGMPSSRRACDDPNNFRMAWHVWDDYPYRKQNLIEGPDPSGNKGFGPPTHTLYDEGELVRRAFLLNDTFELAQSGAARVADREVVKDNLREFLGRGQSGGNGNRSGKQDQVEGLLYYFMEKEHDPPDYFRAGDVARALRIDPGSAGRLIQEVLGVGPDGKKGYPSVAVYREIHAA